GRRHQIRRHLKHLAHPIIGDATHGKGPLNRWWAERLGQQRLWLHAWQLTVPHPVSGAAMAFDSGLQWPAPVGEFSEHNTEDSNASPTADWQRLFSRLPWDVVPETPDA
ncbi:MAG: pseudouridine synthase, partial [Gammaproteobacteria bacterium]|nr:pseudouridine synthase [Gammaproteobacteria bacterium]